MLRQLTRYSFTTSTGLALAVALASCLESGANTQDVGAAGSSGNTGSGGTVPGVGGSSPGVGGTTPGVGGSTTSSGGSSPSTGGTFQGSGGTSGGSAGSSQGSGGTGQVECSNVQHPDHMDKDCSIWPEWDQGKPPGEKDCDADWLTGSGYCLQACGKCPTGGSGGSTGAGGSSSSGGSTGAGGSTGSGGSTSGPGPNLPDITSGQIYWASRYWDCCKTHCASNAGAPSCGQDGVTPNNSGSACANQGSAYACYSEAPRAVGTNVSYGHVAVPNPQCGKCYHLQFTGKGQHNENDPGSQAIAGKHMIVKVSNTGGDVAGNQFDLMIPGGGVGANPNTCPNQWGVSPGDLGPTAGGFLSACNSGSHNDKKNCVRQKCMMLPAGGARDGCLWFVDWLQVADNPQFRYEEISCPPDI